MRIAISGTHCSGKSTLIDEFLLAYPDFIHEPEPYTVLEEEYGEFFGAEPSADDFYRQLDFNVGRLRRYQPGQRVIFERTPVDFLAYMLALEEVGRGEGTSHLIERSFGMVVDGIRHLDLIVFLPLNDVDGIVMSDSEDPELRSAVNSRLLGILINDDLNLFSYNRPVILEAAGSTTKRLRMLESALGGKIWEGETR